MYRIIASANKDSLVSPYPVFIVPISVAAFAALDMPVSTPLTRNDAGGHPLPMCDTSGTNDICS